eukprot:TRINITY_DN9346_c0_g3_i1.p1 TRINITY_DN9346_c0_g3~~TRINITY_DN9346_c0_g3_i1.p1  ORF type:complete len:270 (+),score=94.86 TRINITY_DN9346_c0_g3_i1:576-1385(+)
MRSSLAVNLIVQQVPDSRLRKYPVPITEKVLPYVKEKCQYGYDRLDSLLIIQSPAVNITMHPHHKEDLNALPATSKLTSRLTSKLTLQLYTAIPKGTDVANDFCLGRIDEVTFVWKCVVRKPSSIIDGRFVYFVNETGGYAVLFSPLSVPEEETWTSVYTVWIVENPRLLALYIIIGFFLILFITLSLWCVSIQMKEYYRTARELKEYQQVLQENAGPIPTNEHMLGTQDYSRDMGDEQLARRLEELQRENLQLKAKIAKDATTEDVKL